MTNKATRAAGGYLDDLGPRLTEAFLQRDLLLRPLGNVLYMMPPYVITEDEMAYMIAAVGDVLSSIRIDG